MQNVVTKILITIIIGLFISVNQAYAQELDETGVGGTYFFVPKNMH